MPPDVPLVSFATICAFVAADNFAERCSKVYFATDDYSLMTWGTVNAGLYFLFQEKASLVTGAQRDQLLEYQNLCRDNLETALANLPLLMPARQESIEVLLQGVRLSSSSSPFSSLPHGDTDRATQHNPRPSTPSKSQSFR